MNALWILLPGALVGALVSYALPFLVQIPAFLWQVHRDDTAAEGEWYSYHRTRRQHQAEIHQTRWKIKKSVRAPFAVACWGSDASPRYRRSDLQGKGTAFREFGFLVITTAAKKYQGHWTVRILDPIAPKEHCVPGLWLSFDYDRKLIAGPIIFSRNSMSLDEADSLLRANISISARYGQLGVAQRKRGAGAGP